MYVGIFVTFIVIVCVVYYQVEIETLKHAPNWDLRNRRDSISGFSTHSQPLGYTFGAHSPAPTYHSGKLLNFIDSALQTFLRICGRENEKKSERENLHVILIWLT